MKKALKHVFFLVIFRHQRELIDGTDLNHDQFRSAMSIKKKESMDIHGSPSAAPVWHLCAPLDPPQNIPWTLLQARLLSVIIRPASCFWRVEARSSGAPKGAEAEGTLIEWLKHKNAKLRLPFQSQLTFFPDVAVVCKPIPQRLKVKHGQSRFCLLWT